MKSFLIALALGASACAERALAWNGIPAIDFTNHMVQLSLKTRNIAD